MYRVVINNCDDIFIYPSLHLSCRSLLRTAVIIVPLLGCTWVFGLLAINEGTAVFAWIFTILNSLQVLNIKLFIFQCENINISCLQGVSILFLYVLKNEKVSLKYIHELLACTNYLQLCKCCIV